jgi:PKD repeat protein
MPLRGLFFNQKIRQMKKNLYTLIFIFLAIQSVFAQKQTISYSDNWSNPGFNLTSQKSSGVEVVYSIKDFSIESMNVKGEIMENIELSGCFLPTVKGEPNLPGSSRFIAIPQGSNPIITIVDYRTETYKNINVSPSKALPFDTQKQTEEYEKGSVYSKNALYPQTPVMKSKITQLRGVDVIELGVMPFQYNPVTKDLIVYKDIRIKVDFQGGNGKFGNNRLRSRWFDPILQDAVLNFNSLPKIDYNKIIANKDATGYEYLIIIPNNPEFAAWADTLKTFRTQQGIKTGVVTLATIGGNTETAIKNYISNAYTNWQIPPSAILLMADYGTNAGSNIITHLYTHPDSYPDYASDNFYADQSTDDLPDIVLARMTANTNAQLQVMVSKCVDYERNPPIDPDFYSKPVTALGWQTERWFQLCSEIVGGFWKNSLGKNVTRINKVYQGTPTTDPWSNTTYGNTSAVLNYFGPTGLNYIAATPQGQTGGGAGFDGGTPTMVVNAINGGTFMLTHRDHGEYIGWGEPGFNTTYISSLTNVNNKLPFIFSLNCETGAFHSPSGAPDECFAEKFHRYTYGGQNSGALGIVAATEVSYSFVNDVYCWGMFDNLWPDFMPSYGTNPASRDIRPAFGNAAGKYFLQQSTWPGTDMAPYKQVTDRLFHMHGDAFQDVYSEVPQNLTVASNSTHIFGTPNFAVTADESAFISLTYFDQINNQTVIIGTATGTGSSVNVDMTNCPPVGTTMLLTVTKQNFFRYSKEILVIAPTGPYLVVDAININDGGNNLAEYGEIFNMDVTLKNVGTQDATGITTTISTTDSYVSSILNSENISFPNLTPNSTSVSSGKFQIQLTNNVPDQHRVVFDVNISDNSTKTAYNSQVSFLVNAPKLSVGNMVIADGGDGILDPGETSNIEIDFTNQGHAPIDSIIGTISTLGTHLTLNTVKDTLVTLAAGETQKFVFNVSADPATQDGTSETVNFEAIGGTDGQYTANDSKEIIIGFVPVYCDASSNSATYEYISKVVCGNINNTSTASSYTNFTNISADMSAGQTYPITVTVGSPYSSDQVICWVDWNYNGVFDDSEKTILTWTSPNAAGNIVVPSGIISRPVTMRIRLHDSGNGPNATACGTSSWGEVEDYTVNIVPLAIAGTVNANPLYICNSGTSDLTLTGYIGDHIQWQESADNTTWTDITSANSNTFTTDILTSSKYYRAAVNNTGYTPVYSSSVNVKVQFTPVPIYTFVTAGLKATFTNTSTNATSYSWDFGDATAVSALVSPVHTYATAGTYSVILSAINTACGTETIQKDVTVATVGVNEIGQNLFEIYPNPSNGLVYIKLSESKSNTVVVVTNIHGQEIMKEQLLTKNNMLDFSKFGKGIYFIKISVAQTIKTVKIVIE